MGTSQSRKKIGSEAYTGTTTVGVVESGMSTVFGSVLALIMIVIGFTMILHHYSAPQYKDTTATVVNSSCSPKYMTPPCILNVIYLVDNKPYHAVLQVHTLIEDQDKIDIQYDIKNPSSIRLPHPHPSAKHMKTVGWILLGFGLLIILVSWMTYYVAKK